jgi:Na+/H+ antiporter NhaA
MDGLTAKVFRTYMASKLFDVELSKIKEAILPISGALGGMIIPAVIYLFFNSNTTYQKGFGIPMATDIAFAIGILSLLGNRIPLSLKIFLTALAVIDDLGAILMIALFYTKTIYFINLAISLAIFGFLLLLNRLKINNLIIFHLFTTQNHFYASENAEKNRWPVYIFPAFDTHALCAGYHYRKSG